MIFTDNVNAGTATCTIKGKNEYSGQVQTTFEIKKAKQEIVVASTTLEVVEGAEPFALAVEAKGALTYTISADDIASVDETCLVTAYHPDIPLLPVLLLLLYKQLLQLQSLYCLLSIPFLLQAYNKRFFLLWM